MQNLPAIIISLLLGLLLAPAWAQVSKDEAMRAALHFREAYLKAKQPADLYPLMSKAAVTALEVKQKQDPTKFKQSWTLAQRMSRPDVLAAPPGASKIDKLTLKGQTAKYVTGYELKRKDGFSRATLTTDLILEGKVWKVDFRLQ